MSDLSPRSIASDLIAQVAAARGFSEHELYGRVTGADRRYARNEALRRVRYDFGWNKAHLARFFGCDILTVNAAIAPLHGRTAAIDKRPVEHFPLTDPPPFFLPMEAANG